MQEIKFEILNKNSWNKNTDIIDFSILKIIALNSTYTFKVILTSFFYF